MMAIELVRHESGMLDADTKAKSPRLEGVEQYLPDLVHDQSSPGCVRGQDAIQFGKLVPASLPGQGAQINRGAVGDSEILEGGKQVPANRVWQTDFRAGPAIEPGEDIQVVGALGGCGETKQNLGLYLFQELQITGCGGMVKFIHHHIFKSLGRQGVHLPALVALDRAKKVL